MSIMAKQDRQGEAVARYKRLGRFPNGHQTWAAFAASMQSEKEIYFAFSLMEEPPKRPTDFFFGSKDDVVFGVLTTRNDGKIGKLCFPALSTGHDGDEKLVLFDGFTREDLQLEIDPTDDMRAFMRDYYKTHRRISKIHTERSEVEGLLLKHLEWWIGSDEDRASLGVAEADRLLGYRKLFEQVFPRDSRDFRCSKETVEWLCKLDTTLQEYLGILRKQLPVQEAAVDRLKKRIEEFRLK